jgi:hypothetical protein
LKLNLHTGTHGDYLWLASEDHDLHDLMRCCPQIVLRKYLAITALDGGVLEVTDAEKAAGWETRHGVAYSPRLNSVAGLPHENRHGYCDAGFDEWYVFNTRTDLGERCKTNVFEADFQPGRVWPFVGYLGFAFHNPSMQPITDLFWKQLEWIQPESFIADGQPFLTFVTRNKDLYVAVQNALAND